MFTPAIKVNTYSQGDINLWKNANIVLLHVKIQNNIATCKLIYLKSYDRADIIKNMIEDTLKSHKVNDLEIYINLMDTPINNPFILHFSRTTECMVNTIPNFSFYNWKDVSSDNFFTIKKNILNTNINWDDKIDKIMWSGVNSSNIRIRMNDFVKSYERYEYNLLTDVHRKFIPIIEHSKYKYLLDFEGVGYSGRFPYLALTGSCVILIENSNTNRDYKLYYDNEFQENVHYLKVRYDSNDTDESIHNNILSKINENDCKKIGEACLEQAINVFTLENILQYIANILNYYSSNYNTTTEELNPYIPYGVNYVTKRIKARLINRFK